MSNSIKNNNPQEATVLKLNEGLVIMSKYMLVRRDRQTEVQITAP